MEPWGSPSPFAYDGPVAPEQLIGRRSEVDILRLWARAGRFVALTAPRRYGKTSLIGKLAVEAARSDETAVIVVDLYDVASTRDLAIRLERAWARHTPTGIRERVSRVLAGAQVGLSIAGTGFSVALAQRPDTDPLPALHTLLDLPNQLTPQAGHQRTLIVLDEFQSLGRVGGAEALIRSHAQHQRQSASYLFSGSEPGMLAAAFGERSRPFYGQAETFRLGRLPAGELAEAISSGFERTERHAGVVVTDVVAASEGHPQRAMLLAHLLWSQVDQGQVATADHWRAAQDEALRRVDAEARAVMSGLDLGPRKTLRAVAEYDGPLDARALKTLALAKTTAAEAAQSLLQDGVLERDADGWRVVDPLLARWIRRRLPTRSTTDGA